MRLLTLGTAAIVAFTMAAPVAAQHAVHIDGNTITLRGCVSPVSAQLNMPFETLVWSRGGILTAGTAVADTAVRASAQDLAGRVLYWIDDDDLQDHIGKIVEVRGDLEDIETGELEIDRDDDFTEIRLELDGKDEKIRVPTSWLETPSVARASRGADDDVELKIATRKVDIEDVKVVGSCQVR